MSLLGATLTLPGIAGIVLTIGQAVDSNVLIYERIREEMKGGRTPLSAINAGFDEAHADHRRRQPDRADRGPGPVPVRLRPGQGLRRDAGPGRRHQHVHGRLFQPATWSRSGTTGPAPPPCRSEGRHAPPASRPRQHQDPVLPLPLDRVRLVAVRAGRHDRPGRRPRASISASTSRAACCSRSARTGPADLAADALDPGRARSRRGLAADRRQRRPGDDPRQGAGGRRGRRSARRSSGSRAPSTRRWAAG